MKYKILLALLCTTTLFIPFVKINAQETKLVHNQEELKKAINDENISTITLANDIETTEKINILRSVTIDGNNHTIKYIGPFGKENNADYTVWNGIYVLQFYKTSSTLKNIKLTGGNGGLLVNGAKVNIEGILDVSGNGFGGIELGQGKDVKSTAHLVLSNSASIINTTETEDTPTLWVPKDSTNVILEMNGIQQNLNAGSEFSVQEINTLFQIPNNPNTSDISLSILLGGFISLILFGYSIYKLQETHSV
mgnify:CR=1 FL=1